jgi:GTP-binding protein HflX
LEKEFNAKVIDRTALILEIFGQRAKTKEGIMQVDLAHLSYQRSRLVRSWTHLERQRGGFGFMGGPGETQIEIDRRIIDEKIAKIKYQLEKLKKTRKLHRKARKDVPYPVVALVGYTNAGKSTLFNYLTDAGVMEKDLLFATLDPTMRKVILPFKTEIILSDTVGFISDLPHELIAAFRATLEEVLEADIIIHVRDAANPQAEAQKQDVLKVLKNLGLDETLYKSLIEVLNKIDKLNNDDKNALLNKAKRSKEIIPISAKTGEGIAELLNAIDNKIKASFINVNVNVNINDGKLISWIYDNSQVLSVSDNEEYKNFNLKISSANFQKLQAKLTSFC